MSSNKAHIPRKRFGQHFLTDQSTIEQLVQAIAPQSGQVMVEIGPGQAALTQPLVERLGRLTVIELDRDLAQVLRRHPLLNVIEADVLNVNFAEVSRQLGSTALRVVGNLPYNISTPILFHLLDAAAYIQDQHFMLQKEVVERITAEVDTEHYSRLSVMLQVHYEVENILAVLPDSFDPPPKVDSAVVRMVPKANITRLPLLGELVRVAFSQRRKLLRHTLGAWLTQQGCETGFDLQRRAQEVPVTQYVALAQEVTGNKKPA